jgi:hypothetical protein
MPQWVDEVDSQAFPPKLAFALSNVYTKPRITETKSGLPGAHSQECHSISRLKFDQVDTRNVVASFVGAKYNFLCEEHLK